MSKQQPKAKKSKIKFHTADGKSSKNKNFKSTGKKQGLDNEQKKKTNVVLLPSKNMKDIIENLVKEEPKKPKKNNVLDISKMILGNLENALEKTKKGANLDSKVGQKKKIKDKNEPNSSSGMTASNDDNKKMDQNSPPLRTLLKGKTEEEKKLFSKKIKNMLNVPHEIKFVDEDAKKAYKKKVVKKLRGLSSSNKTQIIIVKARKKGKQNDDKAKEKPKKPITDEKLMKRFVNNGMKLPSKKSDRRTVIDRLWQTKKSLWKRRAQIIKQIEESSKLDMKQKEPKEQGDQIIENLPQIKTYVVPDTVKAAKSKNPSGTSFDSVVYIEASPRAKIESSPFFSSQDDFSKLIDRPPKMNKTNWPSPEKKVAAKVNSWNSRFINKEADAKAYNEPKRENKIEANKAFPPGKMKNRHTLANNKNNNLNLNKTDQGVPQVVREHQLLDREQLGVPEKAYKQIIHDVASFIKKEEKKIVQNLSEKYKDESKVMLDELTDKNPLEKIDEIDGGVVRNLINYAKSTTHANDKHNSILPSKPKLKMPLPIGNKRTSVSSKVPNAHQNRDTIKMVRKPTPVRKLSRRSNALSRRKLNALKSSTTSDTKGYKGKVTNDSRLKTKVKEINEKAKTLRQNKSQPNNPVKSKSNPTKKVKSKSSLINRTKNSTEKLKNDLKSTETNSEIDLGTDNTNSSLTEGPVKHEVNEQARRKATIAQRLRLKMMENKRIFAEMRKLKLREPSTFKEPIGKTGESTTANESASMLD